MVKILHNPLSIAVSASLRPNAGLWGDIILYETNAATYSVSGLLSYSPRIKYTACIVYVEEKWKPISLSPSQVSLTEILRTRMRMVVSSLFPIRSLGATWFGS